MPATTTTATPYTRKRIYTNYTQTHWTDQYFVNGHLYYEEELVDGKVHGHTRHYNTETGELMSEMTYEFGLPHGKTRHYLTHGKFEGEWRNGRPYI